MDVRNPNPGLILLRWFDPVPKKRTFKALSPLDRHYLHTQPDYLLSLSLSPFLSAPPRTRDARG